jgi:hypothetical protein
MPFSTDSELRYSLQPFLGDATRIHAGLYTRASHSRLDQRLSIRASPLWFRPIDGLLIKDTHHMNRDVARARPNGPGRVAQRGGRTTVLDRESGAMQATQPRADSLGSLAPGYYLKCQNRCLAGSPHSGGDGFGTLSPWPLDTTWRPLLILSSLRWGLAMSDRKPQQQA